MTLRALLGVLGAYRYLVSPLLPPSCRYQPTCSCYAEEALRRHGVVSGSALALRRLARCHPWRPGGYDPVPNPSANTEVSP
ncbi:MAG: membrane protein insertion efficiency factor YidD [Pseudomonadota bacterium]|nr:membrane protein insertion efficiency factor YidD [Pseudomonadota bacterium]